MDTLRDKNDLEEEWNTGEARWKSGKQFSFCKMVLFVNNVD